MVPHVVVHNAISVDGRVTGFPVDLGLYYELAGQFGADGILSGCDTLLAAEAELTADAAPQPPPVPDPALPLLAVTDSRGRFHAWAALRRQPYWRDVVALVSESTPPAAVANLTGQGVQHLVAGTQRVDLPSALEGLAKAHGVTTLRVDAGGGLVGALLHAGLVRELSLLVHPHLAGPTGMPLAGATAEGDETRLPGLTLQHQEALRGGCVWLRYAVGAPA